MDITNIRKQFPFLAHHEGMVYFDNAATTQKPWAVIQAIHDTYAHGHAPIHRSSYALARRTEEAVAQARADVQAFIHAPRLDDVVWTKGTTDSLHMVCESYGRAHVHEGDEVIVTVMEHHSNLLPWQRLCKERKAHLRTIGLTSEGDVDLAALAQAMSPRTKLVAISYVSNVLGRVNPIAEVCALAHAQGAVVVVDAAQAAAHLPIDVQALDCDLLAFSGHKMYGPTGIGVLYGKPSIWEKMAPYQVGGGMVLRWHGTTPVYAGLPERFEAGTPHTAGILGLGATIRWLQAIGYEAIQAHEHALLRYACEKLAALPKVSWIGGITPSVGMVTFQVEGMHPLDVGLRLDAAKIAVRTGALCAQPLMTYLGTTGGIRVSFGIYNTQAEIDRFIETLARILTHGK